MSTVQRHTWNKRYASATGCGSSCGAATCPTLWAEAGTGLGLGVGTIYTTVYSIYTLYTIYLGLAGRLAGWLCWQRSKTVVTRWRTVAPAVVEMVGSCRVETVVGGREYLGEGQPEADDEASGQGLPLTYAVGGRQQGQRLQQPHLVEGAMSGFSSFWRVRL